MLSKWISERATIFVLLTGFVHHFDPPTIEKLLRKIHAALAPNGRVVTVEFVPDEDRVTPATAAGFRLDHAGGNAGGRFLSDVRV